MPTQEVPLLEGLLVPRNDIGTPPVLPTFERLDRLVEDARRVLPAFYDDQPDMSATTLTLLGCLEGLLQRPDLDETVWDEMTMCVADRTVGLDKIEAFLTQLRAEVHEESGVNIEDIVAIEPGRWTWSSRVPNLDAIRAIAALRTTDKAEFEHRQAETWSQVKKGREELKRVHDDYLETKTVWVQACDDIRLTVCDRLVALTMDGLKYALRRGRVIIRLVIWSD